MKFDFPADVLRHKQIRLCATDVFLLNTTPLIVIDAPGTGYMTFIVEVLCRLKAGTVAFDATQQLMLNWGTDLNQWAGDVATTAFLNQAVDSVEYFVAGGQSTWFRDYADLHDKDVELTFGGNPSVTVGNGSLVLDLFYVAVPIG